MRSKNAKRAHSIEIALGVVGFFTHAAEEVGGLEGSPYCGENLARHGIDKVSLFLEKGDEKLRHGCDLALQAIHVGSPHSLQTDHAFVVEVLENRVNLRWTETDVTP